MQLMLAMLSVVVSDSFPNPSNRAADAGDARLAGHKGIEALALAHNYGIFITELLILFQGPLSLCMHIIYIYIYIYIYICKYTYIYIYIDIDIPYTLRHRYRA